MSRKQNPMIQAYKGLEDGAPFQVTSNLKTEKFVKLSHAWARCTHSDQESRIGQVVPMLATETVEPIAKED